MSLKDDYNFEVSVSSILKLVVAFLVWSSGSPSCKSDTFVLYAGRGKSCSSSFMSGVGGYNKWRY